MKSELIKEGDEIINVQGLPVRISEVGVGQYGLLIRGAFRTGTSFSVYAPYELPAVDKPMGFWHGWHERYWLTLPNQDDLKLGVVSRCRDWPHFDGVEEHDAKWEETLELMEKEHVSLSTLQESKVIRPVY